MIRRELFLQSTDDNFVKKRKGKEGRTYNYAEWTYYNWRLIQATDNNYNFEVVSYEIINVEPTARKNKRTKNYVRDEDGNIIYEEQCPIVAVHGKLTVPELGSRENFGSAVLQGQSDQWGDAFKAAVSDCFKKCSSMFGVCLDLSGDVPEELFEEQNNNVEINNDEQLDNNEYDFKTEDIQELQGYMEDLGIKEFDGLSNFMNDFSNGQLTIDDLNTTNIKAFNKYLQRILQAEQ